MAEPFVLYCREMPLDGKAVIDVFTDKVTEYRHTIRRMGGFWEATFRFPLNTVTDKSYLLDWFNNRAMFRIEERSAGQITWWGAVWIMELSLEGITRRIDMSEMYNAVKVIYTDNDGNSQSTAWYTDANSITRYGRRELILSQTGIKSGEAVAFAQSTLTATAWPQVEGVRVGDRGREGLEVTAVGDVFLLNNKYVTVGDGTDDDIDGYILDIMTTDAEFTAALRLDNNTLQTKKTTAVTTRVWDKILQLAELGDASNNPWLFWVDHQGAHYAQAENTVLYEWREIEGLVYTGGGQSGWATWPGVLRDRTLAQVSLPAGAFLENGNDIWIAEVEMVQGAEDPHLIPEGFDDAAILRAQQNHLLWMERQEDA